LAVCWWHTGAKIDGIDFSCIEGKTDFLLKIILNGSSGGFSLANAREITEK
jgi:hypothetical protein